MRSVVRAIRLKPTNKKIVGGRISRNSCIKKEAVFRPSRVDLGIVSLWDSGFITLLNSAYVSILRHSGSCHLCERRACLSADGRLRRGTECWLQDSDVDEPGATSPENVLRLWRDRKHGEVFSDGSPNPISGREREK